MGQPLEQFQILSPLEQSYDVYRVDHCDGIQNIYTVKVFKHCNSDAQIIAKSILYSIS